MVLEKDLIWGEYGGFSGYAFWGRYRYILPLNHTVEQRRYAAVSSTEGACSDSTNCYDRCGLSGGRYQITELCSGWLVSVLLGKIAVEAPEALTKMREAAAVRGYTFVNEPSRWSAWNWRDSGGLISRDAAAARRFFNHDCDGRRGSWVRGDVNANAIAPLILGYISIWDNLAARDIQDAFMISRMAGFVMAQSRWILDVKPSNPIIEASQAAFLSFSMNNPTIASRILDKVQKETPYKLGTMDWLVYYLRTAVYESGIVFYPERYGSHKNPGHGLRIALEKLYGIDLPDFAEDLKDWNAKMNAVTVRDLSTVAAIQQALIDLFNDPKLLGPAGVDGKFGPKSKMALMAFQRNNNLKVDGVAGPLTILAMQTALAKLGVALCRGQGKSSGGLVAT